MCSCATFWGVVHNSVVAFPQAADALARFRQTGGAVVLITNAPRPGTIVGHYLDKLGLPRISYDAIMASGESAKRGASSQRGRARSITSAPSATCRFSRGSSCNLRRPIAPISWSASGLFNDDTETPDDYRALLVTMRARNMFMLCANPDLVVERGEKLIYCAGALADVYRQPPSAERCSMPASLTRRSTKEALAHGAGRAWRGGSQRSRPVIGD